MDARTRRTGRLGLLAALAMAVAGPALAQWNAEAFRLYGGTYSADCANPSALKLRVVFEASRRRTLIGQPPAAVAAELDRLWRAEWRQNR